MSVEVIKTPVKILGEGPHWDKKSQCLFMVDLYGGAFIKWNSITGEISKVKTGGVTPFIIPSAHSGFVVGSNNRVCHLDWVTEKLTPLVEVEGGTGNMFNDAKCDAKGRLWAGTVGPSKSSACGDLTLGRGTLYSFDLDHTVKSHGIHNVDISNGIAWSTDNSTMFYVDSMAIKIYAFDYDLEHGSISNQRTFMEWPSDRSIGLPDGLCMDVENKLWVTSFGPGKVYRIDTTTAQIMRTIDLPATQITSCIFGGPNEDELFVTSGCQQLTPDERHQQPLAGSVFRVKDLGVKGMPLFDCSLKIPA